MLKALPFSFSLLVLMTTLPVAAQSPVQSNCDAALVRATYNLSNRVGLDWRLADLVTQETYSQIKSSAGAHAKIYNLPIGANYEDFRSRVESLKKEYKEQLTYDQKLNIAWSGLDPNAINAYHDCLNSQILMLSGLHAVVIGATDQDVSILIRWNVQGRLKTDVDWVGLSSNMESLFPKSLLQGDKIVIVPRPAKRISVAGNAPGYATQPVVLEPLPPPPPEVNPRWVSYSFPDLPAKDGNGYTVGYISNVNLSLFVDPTQSFSKIPYRLTYGFYNGSGTWRGSQAIHVELLESNNRTLDNLVINLDRGHCVYGGIEPRKQEGETSNINGSLVKAINVRVGIVSGTQTPC